MTTLPKHRGKRPVVDTLTEVIVLASHGAVLTDVTATAGTVTQIGDVYVVNGASWLDGDQLEESYTTVVTTDG